MWPNFSNKSQPSKPTALPVIFAELKQETPTQAEIKKAQPPTAAEAKQSTQASSAKQEPQSNSAQQAVVTTKISSTKTATSRLSSNAVAKPTAPAPTASSEKSINDDTKEGSGLAVSKELLSSDPLERDYQQKVLAHLRKTLTAPHSFSGSVRVEIRFSYRQIATDVQVIDSSGNPAFDDWAVKSILVANPFPPVPKELGDNYVFKPTLKVSP